jgi:benzodiazapine receptor
MYLILFLVLNFGALALGGYLQGEGPGGFGIRSLNLHHGHRPAGFLVLRGLLIMIGLSIYMAALVKVEKSPTIYILFSLQLVLNVLWNPLFFKYQLTGWSLFVIIALFLVVFAMTAMSIKPLKWQWTLMIPYVIWLAIATSLNAYVLIKN